MDAATSTEELDDVLDNQAFHHLINTSGWPTSKLISMTSKMEFIHCLIVNEVVHKRSAATMAFRQGLSVLRMDEAFKKDAKALRSLLVYSDCTLSSTTILNLINWEEENTEEKRRARRFFEGYLKDKENDGIVRCFLLSTIAFIAQYFMYP